VQNLGAGLAAINVSATLGGLSAGTVYHYRLVAQNIGGTRSGVDSAFVTVPPPSVAPAPPTNITGTGMKLNGSVNPNGFNTTCYFEYGLTTGYGVTTQAQNLGAGLSAITVSATVTGLSAGTIYHHRLVAQNSGGAMFGADSMSVTVPSAPPPAPKEFVLHQNYPNPFNPTTTIIYALPHTAFVSLTVFNTLGQPIATLVSGEQEAGSHQAIFDGSNLSSGTYFYRLQAGEDMAVRRIVLMH
jgi:hypothetical protein